MLPGTRESAFARIQGNALDSADNGLPDSPVRLRDARLGGIVETQVTDKAGLFVFRPVDPGFYIVELVTDNRTVLAASELLNVAAGDVVSTVVQLPRRIPEIGGLLGHSVRWAAVAAAAAASGVLVQSVTGVDASAR